MNTKTVTKRARTNSARKTVSPKQKPVTKPTLIVVSTDQAFWTVDGAVFHSLQDLFDGLATMPQRVYQYHADKSYQDFAKWVAGALNDKACARELKLATTSKEARKIVGRYLQSYQA